MRSAIQRAGSVLAVVAVVVLFTASLSWAGPVMTPVSATGYNKDWIVEAGGGSTAANECGGYSFYGQGLISAHPTWGLPTTNPITSSADANTTFALQPFTANNVVFLDGTSITAASMTLTTPAKYSQLALFSSTSGGPFTLFYTINYADTTTLTGSFSVPDWFTPGATAVAYDENQRVKWNGSSWYNDTSGLNGANVYQFNITGVDTTKNVASIGFTVSGTYSSGAGLGVFALSGAPVSIPEPGTLALLACGLAGLLCYAWRKWR